MMFNFLTKNRNRTGIDSLEESYREKIKELKDKETEIKELHDAIQIIGYNLHHLGQDFAYERKDSIVCSNNNLKKENGLAMAQIGTELRSYGSLYAETKKSLCIKTLSKMFGETIDNKKLPTDDNFKILMSQ